MKRRTLCAAVALALAAGPAAASERESFEVLKQTTINLIDALVEGGVLTREKADALIRQAEKKAAATVSAKAKEPGGTVRVTYVPEVVRNEIREQIKQEVLAQAKNERWGDPGALPEWLDRIKWEGDLRLRYQMDRFDQSNSPPTDYGSASCDVTRNADLAGTTCTPLLTGNTLDNRERLRVRARLGMLAKVTDGVGAGFRLTTGNTSDRVSTNQTLGQNFNKYTLVLDRAYLRWEPNEWLSVSGGRMPNPWFGTDLVWDDDLNFDGIAATVRPQITPKAQGFVTAGIFPIKEENPPVAPRTRWLAGVQAGAEWDFSSDARLKVGLALYDYRNLEGRHEEDATYNLGAPLPAYGQYAYDSGLRQKGNTLFWTNALGDTTEPNIWGLASKFRPLNLTASVDLARFDPVHVVFTADWVKNLAFDRNEIATRTGLAIDDGKDHGYLYKLTVGMPQMKNPRDWQAYAAYRYLGSDAVLDAFTDSDFGLGGTNLKGYILGAAYGLDRNTVFNLRWLSADSIDSPTGAPGGRFGVDVLQADVNLKF